MTEYDYSYSGDPVKVIKEYDGDTTELPGKYIVEFWVYRLGWEEDRTFARKKDAKKYAEKMARKRLGRYRVLELVEERS